MTSNLNDKTWKERKRVILSEETLDVVQSDQHILQPKGSRYLWRQSHMRSGRLTPVSDEHMLSTSRDLQSNMGRGFISWNDYFQFSSTDASRKTFAGSFSINSPGSCDGVTISTFIPSVQAVGPVQVLQVKCRGLPVIQNSDLLSNDCIHMRINEVPIQLMKRKMSSAGMLEISLAVQNTSYQIRVAQPERYS